MDAVAALSPVQERQEIIGAIRQLDLTSLTGEETERDLDALCQSAVRPLKQRTEVHCAAVCVYSTMVGPVVQRLRGTGIGTAAAAFGPKPGAGPVAARLGQIRQAVDAGADEIDVVVTVDHIRLRQWGALDDEIRAFRDAAHAAVLKVILEAGLLEDSDALAHATQTAVSAGVDFVKTSTGKAPVATLRQGAVILEAMRRHRARGGHAPGFKPAGGIRTPRAALEWRGLVRQLLGVEWLTPTRMRLGASSLLVRLVERLAELTPDYPERA